MTEPSPGSSVPDWDAANPPLVPTDVPDPDTTTADVDPDEDLNDLHAADEDPEQCIGEEQLDPWKDGTALDWPNDDEDDD